MPTRFMAAAARTAVAIPAAASLFLAPAAFATPSGDNGTVKIHDAQTEEEVRANNPHVCTFYLDAFGFDAGQQVDWAIKQWAPTGNKAVTADAGVITLDSEGHGRTEDMKLPDGHYKLFWTFVGEHGSAKHKVFWVECEDGASAPPSASPGQGGQPSASPSGNEGVAGGAEPSSSPSANGSSDDLAETGASSSTGVFAGLGALLLLAGGAVLTRKRLFGRR